MSKKTDKSDQPETLGYYRIKELIASGNMGIVYEGYDPGGQRPVAVKISRALDQRSDLAARYADMFSREAHIASMLHHPNILEVYDSGQQDNYHYIVLELVRSARTLKDWLKETDSVPLNQAVSWILQCLRGLAYAHRKGVIHRDIKPANLLLTQEGKIKIADFSIAVSPLTDQEYDVPAGFVGSPRYMSPEQVQEDQITLQTDLFSLGIIFYELLTGVHPFDATSFSRLIYKLVNDPPQDPRSIKPQLPEPLVDIVLKMLSKDPEQRFEDAESIIEKIESLSIELRNPEQVTQQDRVDRCQVLPFFQDWSGTDLHQILSIMRWQQALTGSVISLNSQKICVLVDGELEQVSPEKMCVPKGECFAEESLLEQTSETILTYNCQTRIEYLELTQEQLELMPDGLARKFYRSLTCALLRKNRGYSESNGTVLKNSHS